MQIPTSVNNLHDMVGVIGVAEIFLGVSDVNVLEDLGFITAHTVLVGCSIIYLLFFNYSNVQVVIQTTPHTPHTRKQRF